ncbi:hypothetical protein PBT90_00045 [Algoriphagus halophytocola]|uniref:hypothetical protein n=1 Tax=Algoriphagus halophytocola TaxID=2991499 RepID=UPI0022DD2222|nr:hypothetical protein [Algoriphagus sp. TR-M9]WBL42365.1 hypothetical protein PBT90_16640 [Algoriphagus sp. TR-M9]WBL43098.1 hypothetical protein PBT90_00045 [Algoriphagus sp. TR-M9]
MIDQEIIKKKRIAWVRQQTKLMTLVQDLESELESMKKRNINEDFIQKKSDQIDRIIELANFADEFIQALLFDNASASIELYVLQKEVSSHLMESKEERDRFFSSSHSLQLSKNLTDLIRESHEA